MTALTHYSWVPQFEEDGVYVKWYGDQRIVTEVTGPFPDAEAARAYAKKIKQHRPGERKNAFTPPPKAGNSNERKPAPQREKSFDEIWLEGISRFIGNPLGT